MVLGALQILGTDLKKVLFNDITVLVNPRLSSCGMKKLFAQLKSIIECQRVVSRSASPRTDNHDQIWCDGWKPMADPGFGVMNR